MNAAKAGTVSALAALAALAPIAVIDDSFLHVLLWTPVLFAAGYLSVARWCDRPVAIGMGAVLVVGPVLTLLIGIMSGIGWLRDADWVRVLTSALVHAFGFGLASIAGLMFLRPRGSAAYATGVLGFFLGGLLVGAAMGSPGGSLWRVPVGFACVFGMGVAAVALTDA